MQCLIDARYKKGGTSFPLPNPWHHHTPLLGTFSLSYHSHSPPLLYLIFLLKLLLNLFKMITGIAHVNLTVPPGTLEPAAAFYSGVLGFTRVAVPVLQKDELAWYISFENHVPESLLLRLIHTHKPLLT